MKTLKREFANPIVVRFDEERDATSAGAEPDDVQRTAAAANVPGEPAGMGNDFGAILLDAWQRSILFWDVLRRRADNMIAHERAGMPPLLDFEYEILLDARRFDRPANYALLRITKIGDDCWEDCVDESKAPVVVVDPRAGHGPGIGGFKRESEVGMAMHEGHPVYFVIFFPEPEPGQTLADVHFALRRFVAEVARRHPDTPPVLYGNCQAGWALTLLAADCEGLTGPVVLNGSVVCTSGASPWRPSRGSFRPASFWPISAMRPSAGKCRGPYGRLSDLER